MESGIYVTFFDTGEPSARELPPVGPLEHVVVRHHDLVADRRAVTDTPDMGGDIARWLEAELELQRAIGEEPGGPKRGEMRIVSRDGVYVRFAVFGDTRERDLVPELGPYAVVVVGRRGLEADGQLLATRTSSGLAAWELKSQAGPDLAGVHKPDVAFRTTSTAYHAQVAPAPPRTHPVIERVVTTGPRTAAPAPSPAESAEPIVLAPAEPVAPREVEPLELPPSGVAPEPEPLFRPAAPGDRDVYTAPAYAPSEVETPALTPADLALIRRIEQQRAEETLRARIQEEERRRLGVDESEDEASTWAMRYRTQTPPEEATEATAGRRTDAGPLLWRLRFAIIGILLLGVGAYGFTLVSGGGTASLPGRAQVKIVGVAQKVSSARWDYIVNGTQRTETAGSATARGVYYVVRLGVTNRGTEGAQLSPNEFVLVDASGTEYRAEAVSSPAYYGPGNTGSQFVWPQTFPVGKAATVAVVFDVDPGLGRGTQLAIGDLPTTRVKLD